MSPEVLKRGTCNLEIGSRFPMKPDFWYHQYFFHTSFVKLAKCKWWIESISLFWRYFCDTKFCSQEKKLFIGNRRICSTFSWYAWFHPIPSSFRAIATTRFLGGFLSRTIRYRILNATHENSVWECFGRFRDPESLKIIRETNGEGNNGNQPSEPSFYCSKTHIWWVEPCRWTPYAVLRVGILKAYGLLAKLGTFETKKIRLGLSWSEFWSDEADSRVCCASMGSPRLVKISEQYLDSNPSKSIQM